MNWIKTYLGSSIGRKQVMGVTGGIVAFWIFMHMVGNIPLLFDKDAYNAYAHMLTSKKSLLYGMEVVMSLVLLAHFGLAITLAKENSKARGPVGYGVNARKGKRSFASFTMIYSGIWILGFLVFHLMTFKFGTEYTVMLHGEEVRDMYRTVMEEFSKLWYATLYVVSMAILSMHLVHAIGSGFQTMGLNHQRWNFLIKTFSISYTVIVSAGFGLTALFAHLQSRNLL